MNPSGYIYIYMQQLFVYFIHDALIRQRNVNFIHKDVSVCLLPRKVALLKGIMKTLFLADASGDELDGSEICRSGDSVKCAVCFVLFGFWWVWWFGLYICFFGLV